jgi:methionyl-tRNA synthetase
MLPADVYARFCRQTGREVKFFCATDEHGTPAELAALAAGMEVSEYCRQQHELQARCYEAFNLSFDHFGRSSSLQNRELTQHLYSQLEKNGHIEEREIEQVYSLADGRFLPDRYVEGTCPHCGFDRARGDQCENCTRVLDPTDLLNPRSAISGSTELERRSTRHLYLKLGDFSDALRQWLSTRTEWSHLVRSIALKWLDEGLQDRGITRDLSWGIPVNRSGFEDKVFYVWFDAPIEYLAASKEFAALDPSFDWKAWWQGGDEVRYVQFMAKDNIPFHTISFPSTIIGSGEPWKLVDQLKGFHWLTYYGSKFSTSRSYGIFMDQALEEFPADYYRYWLMANAPEGSDASFTWPLFIRTINKDLADVLGNLMNRCLTFAATHFGEGFAEQVRFESQEEALAKELDILLANYTENLEQTNFRKAVADLRAIWVLGNNYLAAAAPWVLIKTDRQGAAAIIQTAVNLIGVISVISAPIIPDLSGKIREGIFHNTIPLDWPNTGARELLTRTLADWRPQKLPIFIPKIDEGQAAILEVKYGATEE